MPPFALLAAACRYAYSLDPSREASSREPGRHWGLTPRLPDGSRWWGGSWRGYDEAMTRPLQGYYEAITRLWQDHDIMWLSSLEAICVYISSEACRSRDSDRYGFKALSMKIQRCDRQPDCPWISRSIDQTPPANPTNHPASHPPLVYCIRSISWSSRRCSEPCESRAVSETVTEDVFFHQQ